jgi:hypothetical protein
MPCTITSVNSVLLRRTSWSSYRMTFESFCPRSGIRLCVVCPWQQILQLAHGLGTSMHARGCSDYTPHGSLRSRRALQLQRSALRAAPRELRSSFTKK